MEKREEVVRRMGEAQQGSAGEEKGGKQRGKGEGDEGIREQKMEKDGGRASANRAASLSLSPLV